MTTRRVHLIDGTYELFRAYFGAPSARDATGREVGATRALLRGLNAFLRDDTVTHVACAFDHVVESFRNELFAGYKTGEGMPPDLFEQFPLAERAAAALGIVVWPMIEFEADDALAAAAHQLSSSAPDYQVVICSPDKDLTQCVVADRVVCLDRMRQRLTDETGVQERYGIAPSSIPDWLGLVGDSADGIPGVPRWGAKSASTVLGRYEKIENIPKDHDAWEVKVRGARALAESLSAHRDEALLYRRLATLRTDVPLDASLAALEYRGALRAELEALCAEVGESGVVERVARFRPES